MGVPEMGGSYTKMAEDMDFFIGVKAGRFFF